MLYTTDAPGNGSTGELVGEELKHTIKGILSLLPCLTMLYINCIMLYTLRSKAMFRETSRYLLLYNLLFADTILLLMSQLMYFIASNRVYTRTSLCMIILIVTLLANDISPFNLAVMSLERFAAVCLPLRYPSLVTMRSTVTAIALMWAVSCIITLTRFLLLGIMDSSQYSNPIKVFCMKSAVFHLQIFRDFEKAFTGILFLLVSLSILSAYIGVILAARTASSTSEKALNKKAQKTVLLHFIQQGLIMLSFLFFTIMYAIKLKVNVETLVWINYMLFIVVVSLPRSFSPLIYGLRDSNIRPIFMRHLTLRRHAPVVALH